MKKVLICATLLVSSFAANAYNQCDYSGGGSNCYGGGPVTCTTDSFGTVRCY